jgi:sulfopyruvate decarboxylase TPP-binding subunit
VGILTGIHLGGKRGCMMIQTSGLGNCINALASLAVPYQIPFLLLISGRGELNEFSPCHMQMGVAQRDLLKAISIWHITAEREGEFESILKGTLSKVYAGGGPVALILSSTLTGEQAP